MPPKFQIPPFRERDRPRSRSPRPDLGREREIKICRYVNASFECIVMAMRLQDEAIAEYTLGLSSERLHEICAGTDAEPENNPTLWYPENLRFARALYALDKLAIALNVRDTLTEWNEQRSRSAQSTNTQAHHPNM